MPITPLNLLPQGRMGTNPIMLEQAHNNQTIPSPLILGKTMSSASQGVQTVPQHSVEPLLVHRIRAIYPFLSQYRPHLNSNNPPPVTLLDSLGQTYPRGEHQICEFEEKEALTS